jgi:anti-sigma regulatory factor (Ser/Thr protein kinase)
VRPWPALSNCNRLIIEAVARHDPNVTRLVAERFRLTRQAVNHQLRRLTAAGLVRAKGETRRRSYALAVLRRFRQEYAVGPDLAEDRVWRDGLAPLLADLPENVRDICQYGVTETVNNARDHSGSPTVTVSLEATAAWLTLVVSDEGTGFFHKLREAGGSGDERQAVLDRARSGRFTTDPARHLGHGLFFTSRMFDEFVVRSGPLALMHKRLAEDWLSEEADSVAGTGTHVWMRLRPWAQQTDREVFERYASPQSDYAFGQARMVLPLAAAEGKRLISRSQAQRVTARLDGFAEVTLDFKGVTSVAPAFADEVFRVFRSSNPTISLVVERASEDVDRVLRRAAG